MQRVLRQWLAGLLSLALVLTLLPATALAEEADGATGRTAVEQVQALIDELPDAEEITAENRDDVQAQIDAIDAAMLELTGDEAAALDTARYDAAVAALLALDAPSALEQVQALIDALPDAEEITADNRADVEAQLAAIDEVKSALTDEERDQLDTSRYDAAVKAILALDGITGDDVPAPMADISGTLDDSGFTYEVSGTTLTLTGNDELKKEYLETGLWNQDEILTVIVKGATSIGKSCFENWTNLQSVTLPENLQTIGESAFKGCSSLTFASLPDGLTSIEKAAFRGCKALVSIDLPAGLESIGNSAFRSCKALAVIELPAGLVSIGDYAFHSCESLELTELPSGLKTIGRNAFHNCRSLELTKLPDNVESIGNEAFANCDKITHLTLPASLKSLGSKVFTGNGVISLTFLGKNAPAITQDTFNLAYRLEEILIPQGATGYDAAVWQQDGRVKIGYKVTVEQADNGSASASVDFAAEDTEIVLTATPNAGYHLASWQTQPHVEVSEDSFTMPNYDVTVTPVFEAHTFTGGRCDTCGYTLFEGSGTADAPYLIPDKATLEKFQDYVNTGHDCSELYFKLEDDIDLGGSATPWTPIGNEHAQFKGIFDGNNHTISGLYINNGSVNQGLFGYIGDSGAVKNLTVNGKVSGGDSTGGIVGRCWGSLENCHNMATINGGTHVGGVAGYIENNGSVKNCSNTGTVNGGRDIGGVVGSSYGAIENCYNTGDVSCTGSNVGGVVGYLDRGDSVKNCYNTAAVHGAGVVGGIAGNNNNGTVQFCYNYGAVTAVGSRGAIVGGHSCSDCYYLTGMVDGRKDGAVEKSAAGFRFLASSLGEGWADSVKDRPVLTSNPEAEIIDADTPYEIPDLDTLKAFRDYINNSSDGGLGKTFKLTASITLDSTEDAPWEPIGNRDIKFQGTFDGDNNTINDLYVTSKLAGYDSGLFGYIDKSGTVKGLSVSGFVSGNGSVGGIAANNDGNINDCNFSGTVTCELESTLPMDVGGITSCNTGTISNCTNSGKVTNNSTDVGGIVGDNRGPVINCSNSGEITGTGDNTTAGGIIGSNVRDNPIIGCINTGDVSASRYPAGIVSSNSSSAIITNCYNTGKISASDSYPGGIVGDNYNGIITNCYNTGNVGESCRYSGGIAGHGNKGTIENCYNSGSISGTSSGGIIGSTNGDTITNCYYLSGSANNSIGAGNTTGNATQKSSDEFASGEVAWLLQNGQGEQVWGQTLSSDSYPVLTDAAAKAVCKVTFMANGEEYDVEYANPTGLKELPTDPEKAGYTFEGWSTTESGSVDFDGTGVSANTTVYAVFKEISTPPSTPSYDITIPSQIEGGSVKANRSTAKSGSRVTLTVTPDEGYHLASLTVTGSNGEPVALTDNGDGTYTFTMPSSRVNVEVEFKETAAPTVTVTVSEAPAYGSDITLTAAVTSGSMEAAGITGSVQFTAGGEALGGPVAVENGIATLTVSAADAAGQKALFGEDGTSAVTAEYSGNDDIGPATGTASITVAKRALAYTVTAEDKAYDGSTVVEVWLTPTNLVGDDDVTLTATGNVEKADAGKYSTVDLSDITLSGDDARYYTAEASKDGVELTSPVSIIGEAGDAALHGRVTQDGKPVTGADVTLKQGGKIVASTKTDTNGFYSFADAAAGVYDVVVEKDGKAMTTMVTVTGDTGTERDLSLPTQDVSSVLDAGADASVVAVGGLDEAANSQTAAAGSTVTVKMTIERETEFTAEHAPEIEAAAGGRELDYMAIDLEKETTTGGVTTRETLTETAQLITIVLRFDFTGKSNVVVYRYHGGNVDTLTETANSSGEHIVLDQAGGTITLYVKNFSTYAIGYTQAGETPTLPTPPSSSGSYPSYYSVTVPSDFEGGNVTSNRASAQQGSKITLTVKPDEGYHFGSLTVKDRNGKAVEYKDNGDGTYTFTMPYGKVTVKAEFTKCGSLSFTDLDAGAWYHDYTDYVIAHSLMQGTGGGLFGPDGTVSRAQMVTVLWNMSDKPVVNYYMTYSDVSEDAWYAEAIRWAASEGIVDGYGNGKFGPGDPITREQMAAMIYRYEQKYGDGGFTGDWMYRLPFADLDKLSDWAFEAAAWCNMRGIMSGKSDIIFDPKGSAKRSEMAAILTRYLTQDK